MQGRTYRHTCKACLVAIRFMHGLTCNLDVRLWDDCDKANES